MRLFIGIELDDRMKAAATDVAERLRQRLHRVSAHLDARWIREDNLHITVWFIGEVEDARAAEIEKALKQAPFSTPVFDLAIGSCGAFPPSGPPRVLWLGVREGGAQMVRIYREVGARLAPLGLQAERRDYSAHLTIARVKDPGRGTSRGLRDTLATFSADCGRCPVTAVTLFRSRLSPPGALYEPLLRVPLS